MNLNQLRILTLPVIGATIASFLSGDLSFPLFSLLIMVTLPLFYISDLERVRNHWFWKIYGFFTLILVGLLYFLDVSIKYSIFFLVFFCIFYEFYGEQRKGAPSRLIGLLSFLIVLYHARIESGLALFFAITIYIFSIILCLMLLHVGGKSDFKKIPLRGMAHSAVHFIVIFAVGLIIFWMMPRFQSQNFEAIPSLLGQRISGFGTRVNLNDIGSLKLSKRPVLDLKPLDDEVHSQYIKGRVLDHYQDGTWSTTVRHTSFPRADEEKRYRFRDTPNKTYRYQIDLQPLHGNTIFFMDHLKELKGPLHPMMAIGGRDHISVQRPLPVALSYTVTSYIPSPKPSNMPRQYRRTYMQIPRDNSYVQELSNEICKDLDLVPEKIRALSNFFSRNFSYSLEVHNQDADDPLRYFLYDSKEGHCELFASSMALLLRSQQIPARLVTGFLLPQKHPYANFYHVTEADAHAWVEFFYDGNWQTLDPTPPTAGQVPEFWQSQITRLTYFWRNAVMNWNHDSQLRLVSGLQAALVSLYFAALGLPGPVWALLFSVLIFIFLRPSNWLAKRESRLVQLYARLEHVLEQRFAAKGATEGIHDYLARLHMEPDLRADLVVAINQYHQLRFARKADVGIGELMTRFRRIMKRLARE